MTDGWPSIGASRPHIPFLLPPPPAPRLPQFRLKRCGLGRRVYLVEEHGSAHNLSLPESTLLQAVTNTQVSGRRRHLQARGLWPGPGATSRLGPLPQVIDGFFVKRTADIKESAAYLALLTRGLERLYQVSGARCSCLRGSLSWAPWGLEPGKDWLRGREGVFPRTLAWPQSPLPSGPYPTQSPLGNLRGPRIRIWALPQSSLLTPHLQ